MRYSCVTWAKPTTFIRVQIDGSTTESPKAAIDRVGVRPYTNQVVQSTELEIDLDPWYWSAIRGKRESGVAAEPELERNVEVPCRDVATAASERSRPSVAR
jgi:hypothetical protein